MLPEILENRDGELQIDGVSTIELAKKYGTPLYVISEAAIRAKYRNMFHALSSEYQKIRIFYSAKANTSLSVLRILRDEGAYVDSVSPGEVFLALKSGFPSEKILFTGTSVTDDELRFLLDSGVKINVDSISELGRLLNMATPDFISIRVNPEIGAGHHEHVITAGKQSKFGLWEDDLLKAYGIAKAHGVRQFGLQMHIGSGILNIEPFTLAVERLLQIGKRVHDTLNIPLDLVDIGGGFGVPYRPEEKALDVGLFSDKILSLIKQRLEEYRLGEPALGFEPGRYIVAEAGILLSAVNTIKTTPFKKYAGIDAGFNTLIRPAMYGSYHHIVVANKMNENPCEVYDIAGPLCESGDILGRDRRLPELQEGDLLAILNAGAYGFSMSSQYNSRPRPAEILVNRGRYALVRDRETLDDLLIGQEFAPWLK
jgi:diaminopimelate decarboxylase